MFNKFLVTISSLFYILHLKILKYVNKWPSKVVSENVFKPYLLKNSPSNSNKKILHINGNFIVGGTTQLIVDLIERTSDEYFHHVVVPDFPEPLPYQPVNISKFDIYHLNDLRQFIIEYAPSLVHIQYWVRTKDRYLYDSYWYRAVFEMCEELSVKVVQNINVPTSPFLSPSVVQNVFVSQYVLDQFDNSSALSSVVYPGSDFFHFNNAKIEDLPENSIGMVYRLDADKLNSESIEVFIETVRLRPSTKCYIIGNGFFYKYYMQRVEEENMQQNFVFTGAVSYSELPNYYKNFSVFVAPVHDESFGQVTPFAMNMGLAIAGYDIGAISEILGSKETLVTVNDKISLANVICDLLDNPTKRKEIGHRNQKRTKDSFSVEAMVADYRGIYKSLIE